MFYVGTVQMRGGIARYVVMQVFSETHAARAQGSPLCRTPSDARAWGKLQGWREVKHPYGE